MQFNGKFKFFVVIFLGLSSIFGCSLKSNLDDMHDKTDQMAETTQTMSEQTKALENVGSHTYLDMRKNNTFDDRKKARDCVTNASDISTKLGCAKVYFLAFEFQAWKNEGLDDATKLDIMEDEAVEEFFQFLTVEWKPSFLRDYAPLSPHILNLYAYAAAIHEIDRDQITQGHLRGFKPISLLDIIEDRLRYEYKNPGHDPDKVSNSQYYVGDFKNNAIDLMRKRITFMPLLAYAFLNHVEKKTSFTMIVDSLIHAAVTIDPNKETTDRLDFIGLIMRRALMSRRFLNEIGLDAVPEDSLNANLNIHQTLKSVWVNSNPDSTDSASMFKAKQYVRFQQLTELLYGSQENFLSVDPASYVIPN